MTTRNRELLDFSRDQPDWKAAARSRAAHVAGARLGKGFGRASRRTVAAAAWSRIARAVVGAVLLAGCAPDDSAETPPPELPVLLQQAWDRTVSAEGGAAAEARFAGLQQRNAELRSAIRTRELHRVRAAQDSLRAEQVRVIASALGADGPRQLLDAAETMIAELRERAAGAAADGRDVTRLHAALHEAETSHAEAAAAMDRDEHELALEIALRAVAVITTARVAARSL